MVDLQTLYITGRAKWRAWLAANYASSRGVWLIYYKKHSGKPRIPYNDAVEEAICFGWIDSTIKRLDDDRFMQKFTPRTNTNLWSDLNCGRVARLHRAGKITPAGLAKIPRELLRGKPVRARPSRPALPELPPAFRNELARTPAASRSFDTLAPSYRRNFILWIAAAKRPQTQSRRIAETISLLKQSRRLGMK